MAGTVLVLNVGSSTLKYAAFDGETRTAHGTVSDAELESVIASVPGVIAVGHRVVHGGEKFTDPVRVTPDVVAGIESLMHLAPLHQPKAVAAIRAVERLLPGVPQVACFDTAFHATMPRLERMFALPRSYFDRGIKRYGFHGLSYEYVAGRLREIDPAAAAGKVVVAHLGSGASLCGMIDGKSATTTMGMTPLDGLVMATRCGRLDPGVVLYLIRHEKMTADEVEDLLDHKSGLLGVSGVSGDIRDLAGQPVEMFCRSVAREITSAATVLGGLDAVVFTAGIGEHSVLVRESVCRLLAWIGVRIDPAVNDANAIAIHAADSRVKLFVIPTDEEAVVARHTRRLLEI